MEIIQQDGQKFLSTGGITIPVQPDVTGNPGAPSMTTERDKLTPAQWGIIVAAEGFEYVEGVNEMRLRVLATSIIQNGWYIATKGEVPAGIMNGHKDRIVAYEKAIKEIRVAAPKAPKAPKEPKVPKEPKAPRAPKADTPGKVATAKMKQGQAYKLSGSDVPQTWLDENVFRKGVYEILRDAGKPLTLEQAMPIFLVKCKDSFRGTDGGKNQTKFRLKELVESGAAIAIMAEAPNVIAQETASVTPEA